LISGLVVLTFSSMIIDSRVAEARLQLKDLFPPPSDDAVVPELPVPLPDLPLLPHPKVQIGGIIPKLPLPQPTKATPEALKTTP